MEEIIKIFLVDDHEMVRMGLKFFFDSQPDIEVVGEASSGAGLIPLIEQTHPDVILMDIVMSGTDGIEATREVKATCPAVNILMITSYLEEDKIVDAIYAGASGYVMKNVPPRTLAQAIRIVADGGMYMSPQVSNYLRTRSTTETPSKNISIDQLTDREREVLDLISKGKTNQEISEQLTISYKTVKVHVSNILNKMGFNNRTQVALYYVNHLKIEDDETK